MDQNFHFITLSATFCEDYYYQQIRFVCIFNLNIIINYPFLSQKKRKKEISKNINIQCRLGYSLILYTWKIYSIYINISISLTLTQKYIFYLINALFSFIRHSCDIFMIYYLICIWNIFDKWTELNLSYLIQ